ncbi:MAG: FtsX-like permease family protein [Bacteroidota bacterium]
MFKNHIKVAFRHLLKDKLLSGINILSLSIGLTGALVCYLILQHQLNFDDFHSESEEIYRINQLTHRNGSVHHWSTICYPLPAALRADFSAIKTTQTAGPFSRTLSVENAIGETIRFQENQVLFVDEYYLSFFDFEHYFPAGQDIWLAGDQATAFKNPSSVIVTEAIAKKYFGESVNNYQDVIGKAMFLNNKNALTVTGVLRNPPNNTNLSFGLLVPYEFFRVNNSYRSSNWSGNYSGTAFVSLPNNVSLNNFEETLNEWKKKYLTPEDVKRIEYRLQPLSDIHTNNLYAATPGSYTVNSTLLWGLAGMAAFLLFIGVVNFVNLSTAQMTKRTKEVSINKILGSSKTQLRLQFLSETLMMSGVALLVSIAATHLVVNSFNNSFSLANINLHFSSEAYVFGTGLTLLTSLLSGIYPSILHSNAALLKGLKSQVPQVSLGGFGLRQALIVFQFSIVFLLLTGTILAKNQMDLFLKRDVGFEKENIVTINIPDGNLEALERFRTQILEHPNIEDMSYATGIPMTDDFAYGTDIRFPQESAESRRSAEMKVVDLHYLEMYDLKLKAGRWLDKSNVQPYFNAFVVNEKLVKEMGMTPEEAIGKEIVINEGQAPIIGVVEDFNNNSLKEAVTPCLLFYWNTGFLREAGLKISSMQDLSGTLSQVQSIWKANFPKAIFDYQFVDQSIASYYQLENFIYQTFRIFAIISILIGCIGLYGIMTFITATRIKEIGVRKVLGASVSSIVGLLSKDFLKLILLAFILAAPIAYYFMSQWLANYTYSVPIHWWLFAVAGVLAIGIALLTVSFQSVKAALANPVASLKNE